MSVGIGAACKGCGTAARSSLRRVCILFMWELFLGLVLSIFEGVLFCSTSFLYLSLLLFPPPISRRLHTLVRAPAMGAVHIYLPL